MAKELKELSDYLEEIAEFPKTYPCKVCGNEGRFRYAPLDGVDEHGISCPYEPNRWLCVEHQPYNATSEGWNGEWDDYFPDDFCK